LHRFIRFCEERGKVGHQFAIKFHPPLMEGSMPGSPKRTQVYSKRHNGVYYYEPYRRSTGKVWYIDFSDSSGKRIREKIGSESEGITAEYAAHIRAQRAARSRLGIDAPAFCELTLEEGFQHYYEWLKKHRKQWEEDRQRYYRHVHSRLGNRKLGHITRNDVEQLQDELRKLPSLNGQTMKEASVRHYIVLIRRTYNRLRKLGIYSGTNPCDGMEFPKLHNEIKESLTTEQETQLLRVLDGYQNQTVANIIRIAFFTGMRRGEITGLKWDAIPADYSILNLGVTKGNRVESIPTTPIVRQILKHQRSIVSPEAEFVFPGKFGAQMNNFDKAWVTIKELAGIPAGFRFHGLRHHFASKLAKDPRITPFVLMEVMRHKDITTTKRYIDIGQETVLDAMSTFQASVTIPLSTHGADTNGEATS